jgi:hypothetical protein
VNKEKEEEVQSDTEKVKEEEVKKRGGAKTCLGTNMSNCIV